MKNIDKIEVCLQDGTSIGTLRLTTDRRKCAFEYTPQWIAGGYSISPLELPLESGVIISKNGNFGIFEDSIPDGYSCMLLRRMLSANGENWDELSPLQRLSVIGDSGMGDLCYRPVYNELSPHADLSPELDLIQAEALKLLSSKESEHSALLYYSSGNTGGSRPKIKYRDEDGDWIVKFRHPSDDMDAGRQEFYINSLARKCGIDVPDFKLLKNKYFACRRFDIADGKRVHIASAAALLNIDFRTSIMDYKDLLALTGYLTQDSMQVEEMYRRMVFNVAVENMDDHAKNFSFTVRNGRWRLSPAYDLTRCIYDFGHASTVDGNSFPSREDMITVGLSIRIPKLRCMEIIAEVDNVITKQAGWK